MGYPLGPEVGMLKEFREFAMRGNVLDLAVGVIIGAAFGGVVNSLVNDVLMPPIGKLLGGVDFQNFFIPLNGESYSTLEEVKAAGVPAIAYGIFINTLINFLIVAFAVFILIKQVNRFRAPAPVVAPVSKECLFCGMSIPVKATKCPHCTSDLKSA